MRLIWLSMLVPSNQGNLDLVESDIRAVVVASGDKLVKVIIEACLLTNNERWWSANYPRKQALTLSKHQLDFQLVVPL